jgi:hypothetical protein
MEVMALIASCQTAPTEACSASAIMPTCRAEIAHLFSGTHIGAA